MFLDALPLLPNGKLNRLAHPDPGNRTPSGSGWHPPQLLRPRRSFAGSHTGCAGGHQEIPPGATITIVISIPSVAEVATVITQYQGKMFGEEELARILTELEINVGRGSEAARRYQSPNKKVRNLYE